MSQSSKTAKIKQFTCSNNRCEISVLAASTFKSAICQFLPSGAMHKRGLCRRAVSVHPSVHLGVRHVHVFC